MKKQKAEDKKLVPENVENKTRFNFSPKLPALKRKSKDKDPNAEPNTDLTENLLEKPKTEEKEQEFEDKKPTEQVINNEEECNNTDNRWWNMGSKNCEAFCKHGQDWDGDKCIEADKILKKSVKEDDVLSKIILLDHAKEYESAKN